MVTSGFRAEETTQLTWDDIEFHDDKQTYYCRGVGKGGKAFHQPLYADAVDACRSYFRKAFKRKPESEDWMFWTLPSNARKLRRKLCTNAMWKIVKNEIGEPAKANGIINRKINFYPHLLRKTYATLLYEQGMGLADIKVLTRHSNLSTLENHYLDTRQLPTRFIDKALGRTSPGGSHERTE